jgi:hypothetical protein
MCLQSIQYNSLNFSMFRLTLVEPSSGVASAKCRLEGLFDLRRMLQLLLQNAVALYSSRNLRMPDAFCIAASTNCRFSFPLPLGLRLVPLSHLCLDRGGLPWLRHRRSSPPFQAHAAARRPPPPPRSAAGWAASGGSSRRDGVEGPLRRGSPGGCISRRR